jgi:hypothetical protein
LSYHSMRDFRADSMLFPRQYLCHSGAPRRWIPS